MAALADLLTLVEDRPRDTVDRARQDRVAEPADRMIEREIPGIAERLRIGPRAQAVGRHARHADRAARFLDAAARGERLDERDLLIGGPAVAPGTDRSEEHTSEPQPLMRNSYAVFCLKKTTKSN